MRGGTIYTMLATSVIAASCADVIGFPDYRAVHGTGGASSGGSGGTTTGGAGSGGSTTSSSSSSTSSTSSATGGAGGAAPIVCAPDSTAPCYSGAPETIGVGTCTAGTKTCATDGTGYGPCVGEIAPLVEQCGTPAIDESCDGIATCTGQIRWGKSFGDSASQRGNAIAAGKDGRVAVTGTVQGAVDFGGGPTSGGADDDAFVAVYGSLGQPLWSKRLGDTAAQNGAAVAIDPSGSVVVAGSSAGAVDFGGGALAAVGADGFVAKYDPAGALLWAKLVGGAASDGAIHAVAAGADGSTFVAGHQDGSLTIQGCNATLTATLTDAFVARFDPSGACAWLVGFGSAGDDAVEALAIDTGGNVVVAGTYADATIDVGGTMLTNAGGVDAFVAKLAASDGKVTWARSFGGLAEQSPWAISGAKASSDLFVVGRSTGVTDFGNGFGATPTGVDAWIVRLDKDGKTIDAKPFGGAGDDYGQALAVDDAGNPIVGVNSNGAITLDKPYNAQGAFDAYVIKLDAATLQVIWSQPIAATGGESLFGLATDPIGRVLVAGTHTGAIDLGGVQIDSQGAQDVFVLGLAP